MNLKDELVDLLPTKSAKLVALATAVLAGVGFYLPHHLSPLWPKSTQAEIVLAQILVPALIALLGSLVLVGLMISEVLTLKAALNKAKDAAASAAPMAATTNVGRPKPPAGEPDALDKKLMLLIAKKGSQTVFALCKELDAIPAVIELHLHDLQKRRFVSMIESWQGAEYWQLEPEGTRYLVSTGALA